MSNRIRELRLIDRTCDPVELEAWVEVVPEASAPDLEVRGRLVGPRNAYGKTIEVPYPVRPFADAPPDGLRGRMVVPEGSLWEPECPHLYEGVIELWQAETKVDERRLSHGFCQLRLGANGLFVNGRRLALRGAKLGTAFEERELQRLCSDGRNLLLVPADDNVAWVCEIADHVGLFVLAVVEHAEAVMHLERAATHVSFLGTVVRRSVWGSYRSSIGGREMRAGILLDQAPVDEDLHGASFIVCDEQLLSELSAIPLPRIVLTSLVHASLLSDPPIIGQIFGTMTATRCAP
jgi:hypothetical protein